jgi:hypothetical protein
MIYGQKNSEPVNKDAALQVRKLLDYFYSISGRRVIAGHHNYVVRPTAFLELSQDTYA